MMMADKAFVDTNILLRAVLPEMPQHVQIDALLKHTLREGTELWISGQVIREFIVQTTHPRTLNEPLTVTQIVREVEAMKSLFRIADETTTVRDKLLELLQTHPTGGKQVHDANIVATMQVYGINILFTLNVADFKRFSDVITIISPVDKA
ncbi:MAG: type II toxin-antitoxin system VapC family toxin [Anaerolineaceae bacterium]|nr:type II toxin-antitoxin system VapC family toxin [Anaerolineaceae bacterium]